MSEHYLIEMQYIGFRYHGWQKQPGVLTIQQTIESAIQKLFQTDDFQILAASRTDSMVSALQNYFLLMINSELDCEKALADLNELLPIDIRLKSIKKVSRSFRIIGAAKFKEYHYHFSFGGETPRESTQQIVHFSEELDSEMMNKAAGLFVGTHSFHNFVHKDRLDQFEKRIDMANIQRQEDHWVFKISGPSFMRHQVRLMMGALLKVGSYHLSLDELRDLLLLENKNRQTLLVPALGLVLYRLAID